MAPMDEEMYGYEWDEGSDVDNWETEQVFLDSLIDQADAEANPEPEPEPEPREDFGYFGEAGLWD